MNQKLQELTQKTDESIKTHKAKERRLKNLKEKAKFTAWTILMVLAGVCYTISYYEWQVFRNDYLTAENTTRIIERNHSAVMNSEEKSDDEGAYEQEQPASVEEITSETPLHGRTVEQIIEDTAKQHGFKDIDLLKRIAMCESSMNPNAQNANSTAVGAFQYLAGTWEEGCRKTGNDWTLEDRTDVEKATRMAIYHISRGELSRWNASKTCWGV